MSNDDRIETFELPGGEQLLAAELADLVRQAGGQGVTRKELAASIGLASGDPLLGSALAELHREGTAVEHRGRWAAPEATGLAVGTIRLTSEGKGVVTVDRALEGEARGRSGGGRGEELAVARRFLGGARNGDRVLVEPARRRRGGGWAVVEVLERRRSTIVGRVRRDGPSARPVLVPFDVKIGLDFGLVGQGARDLEDGVWAVAEVVERSTGRREGGEGRRRGSARDSDRGSGPPMPRARVVERLGTLDEPAVDSRVVLRHLEIPEDFPPEVERAVRPLPADPEEGDFAGRQDLRHLPTLTIDGASARDFDDAVSIAPRRDGGFRLGVHIADVAHYVAEASELDREAYRRGTSVYFPERAVPMLPERLSNGLCSLRPNVPRLALSALLDFDRDGALVGRRFAETVIESDARLTYSQARDLIEGSGSRPGGGRGGDKKGRSRRQAPSLSAEVHRTLLDAARLAERLRRRRHDRGALDLDLVSGEILVDRDGRMTGVQLAERNVAHRLIEELMIAANEAVAEELAERGVPALYRIHEPPDPDALEDLELMLGAIGLHFDVERAATDPGALVEMLDELAERTERSDDGDHDDRDSESELLSALVLRSLSRARYDAANHGHYALASAYYTHFTSPIRRYPDLVVHRQLKSVIDGSLDRQDPTELAERLPAVAERTSFCERRAEAAERTLGQWKKVRFLAERIGEHFFGRVTGVQPFGLFLHLEKVFTDGLIGVRDLGDDFWVHDPQRHELVGERTGHRYRLGQRIEVELVGVDEAHRGLDLRPVDPAGGRRRRSRRREPPRREKGLKGKGKRPARRRRVW